MDRLFGPAVRDAFREVRPSRTVHLVVERGRARANNVGWRIDYQW